MLNNIVIRSATMNDIDSMAKLLEQLFFIEEDFKVDYEKQKEGLERLLEYPQNSKILIAELDGLIVGMLTAQICISTAEGAKSAILEDMVVDIAFRRMGIGKSLMKKMEEWVIENNIKRLQLLADKNNSIALKYYQELNWKITQLICLRKFPSK
jgi:ribosomal protein S18 acetylase RimI-like enzyme